MEDFLNLFEVGRIVSTRFGNQNDWVNNSVTEIDYSDSIIEVYLNKKYIEVGTIIGQQMEIRVTVDAKIYSAIGKTIEIIENSPKKIKVKVNSLELIDANADKRDNMRHEVKYDCIVRSTYIPNSESLQVVNISSTGIGILGSRQNIPIGENIFVDIFLNSEKILKFGGKIVRKKINGYEIEYGVNCKPVDDKNQEVFKTLLEELNNRDGDDTNYVSVIKKIRSKSLES